MNVIISGIEVARRHGWQMDIKGPGNYQKKKSEAN
jgi:hypothetical protein